MSISPVGGVGAAGFVPGLAGISSSGTVGAGSPAAPGSDALFGATLTGSVDRLQSLQSTSDALGVRAVTGDLDDVHDYTIASSQAGVALELTAALRNKAVEAFTEIMRMQA